MGTFGLISLFKFIIQLTEQINDLLRREYITDKLEFRQTTDGCFVLGIILAVVLLGMIIINYIQSTKYGGSNPIYTWKRVPRWWEMHVRCLAMPMLGFLAVAIEILLLCGIYYRIYRCVIPEQLMPQNFDGAFIAGLEWGFK